MANYSDIFPLSGGSSSLAGLTSQGTKSTNFTASVNSLYEITDSCLMTLPSSPSVNDKVGFLLTSPVNFDITSTDKFNGSLLVTDYVKRVTQTYVIIILTYSGSTNGWTWESRDNSYISTAYIGSGIVLPYTSTSSLDGAINYIGTASGTTSFSNPYPSLITITGGVTTVGHNTPTITAPSVLSDKSTTTSTTVSGVSNTSSDCGFKVLFPSGGVILPSIVGVYINCTLTGGITMSIEGIKSDNSLENIGSTSVALNFNGWKTFSYGGNSQFKGFYWHAPNIYYSNQREFEVWGTYIG